MPISFSVDSTQQLVITICVGELSEKDFQRAFSEIKLNPEYKTTFNELWDIRETIDLQLSFQNWQGIDGAEIEFKTREAIVVATETQYLTAKKYVQLGKSAMLDIKVFYDYDEALLWITKRIN